MNIIDNIENMVTSHILIRDVDTNQILINQRDKIIKNSSNRDKEELKIEKNKNI